MLETQFSYILSNAIVFLCLKLLDTREFTLHVVVLLPALRYSWWWWGRHFIAGWGKETSWEHGSLQRCQTGWPDTLCLNMARNNKKNSTAWYDWVNRPTWHGTKHYWHETKRAGPAWHNLFDTSTVCLHRQAPVVKK